MAINRVKRVVLCSDLGELLRAMESWIAPTTRSHFADVAKSLTKDHALFLEAFSDMAQRTLLTDMISDLGRLETLLTMHGQMPDPALSIAPVVQSPLASVVVPHRSGANPSAWRRAPTPSSAALAAPWVDLKKLAVKLKDAFIRARNMPKSPGYTHVTLLGYKVKTGGDSYKGDTDDYQDMLERCNQMKDAIRQASTLYDSLGATAPHEQLKVFMAPEFFFRGLNGAYDLDTIMGWSRQTDDKNIQKRAAARGILEIMRDEISKPAYADWLFVLGTAIGATKRTRWLCDVCGGAVSFAHEKGALNATPTCVADAAHAVSERTIGAQIDNVAIVVKGSEVNIFTKELISGIDFRKNPSTKNKVTVRAEELDVIHPKAPSGYDTSQDVSPKFADERMGGGVFTMDGVRFGLEICLDHAATTSTRSAGRLAGRGVQILLVPSAGMKIRALPSVKDAIIFNVDGATPHVEVVVAGDDVAIMHDHYKYASPVKREDFKGVRPLITDKSTAANFKPQVIKKLKVPSGGDVVLYGPYAIPTL